MRSNAVPQNSVNSASAKPSIPFAFCRLVDSYECSAKTTWRPSAQSDAKNSYGQTAIGKRMVVVSAGVFMNLLIAIVFFLFAFLAGVQFNAPIVGEVFPGEPAAEAGMRSGETILAINGDAVRTFADVQIDVAMADPGQTLTVEVGTPGDEGANRSLSITPHMSPVTGLQGIGISPASSTQLGNDPRIAAAMSTALHAAGLGDTAVGMGWTLQSVNGQPISTWNDWARTIDHSNGVAIETKWAKPGDASTESITVEMTPRPNLEILRYPEAMPITVPNYEEGLIGLAPLAMVESIDPSSGNLDRLQPGDVIVRAAGVDGPRSAVFRTLLHDHAGRTIALEVLRDGKRTSVDAALDRDGKLGVYLAPALETPLIATPFLQLGSVEVDASPHPSPVAKLQLLALTRFTAVGDTPVNNWTALRGALQAQTHEQLEQNKPATLTLAIENPTPGHEAQNVQFTLSADEIQGLHKLGWSPPISSAFFDPLWTTLSADGNPMTAISMGFTETKKMVVLTYLTIYRLAQGSVGVEQLRGPVGIVHLGSRIADRGVWYLIFFLAMISVNLAVLNFLPLPIVDGGLFLYLVYEKFKGRPPSIGFQNAAALVGLLLIGSLFVVTFYNDVMRLIG